MLELAATIDAGLPLVQTTYTLAGDGPLAFSCYERLDKLMQAIRISHFPNVSRIAQLLSNGQPNGAILSQQFTQYAKSCVQPGYEYFQDKFHGALCIGVAAFRAAHPHKVRDLQLDANAVDEISAFPFLNDTKILDDLKAELTQYLASAADVVEDVDIVDWWKRHAEGEPC